MTTGGWAAARSPHSCSTGGADSESPARPGAGQAPCAGRGLSALGLLSGVMFLRQFAPKGNEEEQLFDSISGKKKKGLACYYGSPRDPRRRLAACPSDITCLRCSSAGGRSPAGQGTGCCALTGSRRAELGAAGAPAHEASRPAPPAQGISRGRAARVPPRVGSQAGAKPEPRQTATEKDAGHSQGPAPMGWGTATAPEPLCHQP